MSRLVQVAWLLPSLWLILFAVRVAIADLREHGRDGAVSWCDCEPPCEVTR